MTNEPAVRAWDPPADLDPECLELCRAINDFIPGVVTTESCCGHGKEPYRIWVDAMSLDDLPPLLYWLDQCHTGFSSWHMLAYTDCSAVRTTLMIEGPISGYAESEYVANRIRSDSTQDPR